MARTLLEAVRRVADARVPCYWCGGPAATGRLCGFCHAALPRNVAPCAMCGAALRPGGDAGPTQTGPPAPGQRCGLCRQRARPFDATVAPLLYESVVVQWISRLKRRHGLIEADIFADLLLHAIIDTEAGTTGSHLGPHLRPHLIVPVPLAYGRLMRRGYNQATLLARPLGRRLGIEVVDRAARRVRRTPYQRRLSRTARMTNLRGAFDCRRDLTGLTVAIVDDVMTTGETVAALARTLRGAGAQAVHVWVAARA